MDGNGRWAEQKGEKRSFGHEAGAKIVREITSYCAAHDEIKRLTLYAFSTENWKRPRLEVEFLMKLLEKYLKQAKIMPNEKILDAEVEIMKKAVEKLLKKCYYRHLRKT